MAPPVDSSRVCKRPVECRECEAATYFTLREIAESQRLACAQCKAEIDLTAAAYQPLVEAVRARVIELDSFIEGGGGISARSTTAAQGRLGLEQNQRDLRWR